MFGLDRRSRCSLNLNNSLERGRMVWLLGVALDREDEGRGKADHRRDADYGDHDKWSRHQPVPQNRYEPPKENKRGDRCENDATRSDLAQESKGFFVHLVFPGC